MRQKVLYIITKSDIGGAQKYVSNLAANLNKNKFEAKILYGGKDLRWLSNKIWPFFINDWLAIFELARIYSQEKPGIVHLNSSKAGVLGSIAAKIYKVKCSPPKIIFTAHGWIFNPTNAISLPVRWFYILLHKIAARFQDTIICVSEYDYNLALSYRIAPKEKLTMIHNGIDPNIKFLDEETAKKEIFKKLQATGYKLQANFPWIGSIGRLVKEKNYETLVAAAKFIPDAYFFIIGEGLEKNKLQVTCQILHVNNVFFIDPTGNDVQYLKAFDIFIMSSIKEGLPYILLEAMLAGLPAVVTEAGGMPEVIKNHENGLMVSQKNPEMLAKAIQGLLKNSAISQELSAVAKKSVENNFNLQKMVAKTELVYQSFEADNFLLK